jgi:hypothetical protein
VRIDATPSAWRDAVPLGSGTALRYTRSSCDGSGAQPISQGAAELPVPRIGARDTQYRRRKFAGQLHAKFARDARTVPPMPVATCVTNHPERRSASVDHEGHGERLTRRRSRLTALGSCGESPYDAAVRCCGRCRSCDTVTRGCTQWSARGRRALLNDLARQGNPSGISLKQ